MTLHYPVVTKNEALTTYENLGIDTDWINTGWDYDAMTNTSRVATPDHIYQSMQLKTLLQHITRV